jgi:hypothetical protein
MSVETQSSSTADSSTSFTTFSTIPDDPIHQESPLLESLHRTSDGQYILWSETTKDAFANWWQTTSWYEARQSGTYGLPSWDPSKRTTTTWEHYNEVASVRTGKPFVECKICERRIEHPATKNRGGTSALKGHLTSEACKRKGTVAAEGEGKFQSKISFSSNRKSMVKSHSPSIALTSRLRRSQ